MSLGVRVGGALKPALRISVKTGGAVAKAKTVKMMRGGTLTTIWVDPVPPLSAACSPTNAYKFAGGPSVTVVTSGVINAVVTGGTSPFAYGWTVVSYTGNAVSITSPGSASTTFRQVNYNSAGTALGRCTVTDANGAVATCDVNLRFEHYQIGQI